LDACNQTFPAVTEFHFIWQKDEPNPLTSAVMESLGAKFPNLRSFKVQSALHPANGVTDAAMLRLVRACPKLLRIDLRNCPSITDNGLRAFIVEAPQLQALAVDSNHWSDDMVAAVANIKGLKELTVQGTPNTVMTDAALASIRSSNLQLRSLSILINPRASRPMPFTKEAVIALLGRKTNLSEFGINGCADVDDAILDALAIHSPHLRIIYISTARAISLKGTVNLSTFCKDVTFLSLLNVNDAVQIDNYLRSNKPFPNMIRQSITPPPKCLKAF
jgi:hypothetical protein